MRYFVIGALYAVAILGCGGAEGPKTYRVSGTVTIDNQPIEDGYIIFKPTDPADRADGTAIVDGKYEMQAVAGTKKVEIQAMRTTDEKGSKGEPVQENYLPAEYNTATTLTADVTPEGPNEFDFDLKSKP